MTLNGKRSLENRQFIHFGHTRISCAMCPWSVLCLSVSSRHGFTFQGISSRSEHFTDVAISLNKIVDKIVVDLKDCTLRPERAIGVREESSWNTFG